MTRAEVHRTIQTATYTPRAARTDDADWCLGDVTYVTFAECSHVQLGNPAMHFKVGSSMKCRQCSLAASEAQS